jgi:hypothetical protein
MRFFLAFSTCLTLSLAVLPAADESGFVPIFDGKSLDGWKSAKSTGPGDHGPFSINKEEQAIHVYAGREAGSEQEIDCLVSEASYDHYILRMEYKWLEKRFAPRVEWDRDAGLLFHVHGDLTKVWPESLEMQIGESPADKPHGKKPTEKRFHVGDLFVLGKTLSVEVPRSGRFFDPKGKWVRGKHCQTPFGVEKPKGEWNEIEIRVNGSESATFILNGETTMEIRDFRKGDKPLSKGHIGLQAEWAELLYRNIRIKKLPSH